MGAMGRLSLLFVVVPLLDLWVLLRLAAAVGPRGTLALIVLPSLLGAWLARREGLRVLRAWPRAPPGGGGGGGGGGRGGPGRADRRDAPPLTSSTSPRAPPAPAPRPRARAPRNPASGRTRRWPRGGTAA